MTGPQPVVALLDHITEFDFELGEQTMATAVMEAPKSNVVSLPQSAPPIPLKIGEFGAQGSGKSSTAALIAAAISAQFCNRAPVFVVDPELAWAFLKRRIFDVEGIELIHRPYRSFAQMHRSIHEAEKLGCCVWIVDPLTLHWSELLETYKKKLGFIPIDAWGDIRDVWNGYISDFLNTKMTTIAAGRLGNDFEEQEKSTHNGATKIELVKVGTKFKAGGGESFGYEPHLLFEMSLERKSKRVRGQEREGEGRMIHRVDVLKDRTWALNGQTMRWTDRPGYSKGDFKHTWNSILPHFREIQAAGGNQMVGSDTSSELVAMSESGRSEYYEKRQRKEVLVAELHATMELLWGGQDKNAKQMRLKVFEHIFGFRSKEAADAATLDVIERGVHILQAFEKRCKKDGTILGSSDENILANLDIDIREFDQAIAEEQELPF